MPNVSRRRALAAPPEEIWEVVADPHHLPRWWPGVKRVEGVTHDHFTQVLMTKKGRPVRLDFRLLESEPPRRRLWEQEIAGSPFERFMSAAVTELVIEPGEDGSEVTIEQRHALKGYSRMGAIQFRRATGRLLDGALDGLQELYG